MICGTYLSLLCAQSGVLWEQKTLPSLWEQEVKDGVPQPVRAHRHLHIPAKPGAKDPGHTAAASSARPPVPCACIGIDLGMAKPATGVAMALPHSYACERQARPWPSMPEARHGRQRRCSCGEAVHDKCHSQPKHPGRRQVRKNLGFLGLVPAQFIVCGIAWRFEVHFTPACLQRCTPVPVLASKSMLPCMLHLSWPW